MELDTTTTPPPAPPTGLAPPTEQGGPITGPVSLWPNALGVLCIIAACFGGLYHGWTVVSPSLFQPGAAQMGGASFPTSSNSWLWVAAGVMNLLLSIGLLVVGIGIARRSRSCVNAARSWSVLKLIVALTIAVIAHIVVAQFHVVNRGSTEFETY